MKLSDHPTVKGYENGKSKMQRPKTTHEAAYLKQLAMEAGADDVGIISLSCKAVAEYKQGLLEVMPDTQSVMVLAFRVNQTLLRSQAHSVVDNEFKQGWTAANKISRQLVARFGQNNIKALNMPTGFPFEAKRWPGKMWLTCDKDFAVEAGLGQMGYNRLVLHPVYGASILLGTILLPGTCDTYDTPIDYNPCIHCGLCLKVCPVGAIKKSDDFNFVSCYSHNYRERLGGFQNWVEQVVDSRDHADYRRRVSDSETISMWQNLSIGSQTRCDRCVAICPAGENAIGEYIDDRKDFGQKYLKPFQDLEEIVYVVNGSDAAEHVQEKFPFKQAKVISNGIRPVSVEGFLGSLFLVFQPNQSKGLDARYHFTFTGKEKIKGTVTISNQTLSVDMGHVGKPDLHVFADSETWIRFLAKEVSILRALITRKIKIKGSPKLLKAFARCFPS